MMGRIRDAADVVFPLLLIGMFLLAVAGVAASTADMVQSIRAEPATIECRVRQMDAVRPTFSTDVTCVPFPKRRDTVAVQEVQP